MSRLRIAICQIHLRDTRSFAEMEDHLAGLCRQAMAQDPQLILFPEFTTFGLLAMAGPNLGYADLGPAIRDTIAAFTPNYLALFSQLAAEAGAVILGGSTWVLDGSGPGGHNTAHLFYPDGRVATQRKNHLFPGETDWGTATWDHLVPLEIPGARVGVMTCYDSEFPEVGRHFLLAGAQVLLCPSATYTIRGFHRVRRCCAARAVENQLYVAEGHQVGALSVPVDQPLTGYGRSALLCPIDDCTGVDNGVLAEAESAERELVLTGDLDLDLLERSRKSSEATILQDRRPQTYRDHYRLL